MVMGFPIPIKSPLYTTVGNFVALSLIFDIPWAYFHPNPLLRQLSLIPQLETSGDTFNTDTYFLSDDTESQLLQRAVMRRGTPYLRRFGFQGANAYLEALLPQATVRLLERLQLYLLDQLKPYLILPRRQFICSAETARLKLVRLTFLKDHLRVDAFSHDRDFRTYHFGMSQGGKHFDWQLASVTKFFRTLRAVFSPVEHLILKCDGHLIRSESESNNEADLTQWRELFRVFSNLKSLYMGYGFVGQLSQVLQPDPDDEGESHTADLLPELRDLWYAITDDPESVEPVFAEFAYARRNAGRPVNVFQAAIYPSRWVG